MVCQRGVWSVEAIRCQIAPLTLGKGNVGVCQSEVTRSLVNCNPVRSLFFVPFRAWRVVEPLERAVARSEWQWRAKFRRPDRDRRL